MLLQQQVWEPFLAWRTVAVAFRKKCLKWNIWTLKQILNLEGKWIVCTSNLGWVQEKSSIRRKRRRSTLSTRNLPFQPHFHLHFLQLTKWKCSFHHIFAGSFHIIFFNNNNSSSSFAAPSGRILDWINSRSLQQINQLKYHCIELEHYIIVPFIRHTSSKDLHVQMSNSIITSYFGGSWITIHL